MSEKNKNIKKSVVLLLFCFVVFFLGGGGAIGISPRASNWLETALHTTVQVYVYQNFKRV